MKSSWENSEKMAAFLFERGRGILDLLKNLRGKRLGWKVEPICLQMLMLLSLQELPA
jgi:hypothetical protein